MKRNKTFSPLDERLRTFYRELERPLNGERLSIRRLRLLRGIAGVGHPIPPQQLKAARRRYEQWKWRKSRRQKEPRQCWCCLEVRLVVWHHILPLVYGGAPRDVRNIVQVCEPCHAKIHPWLEPKPLLPDSAYAPIWS